jgi:hypothetical protein
LTSSTIAERAELALQPRDDGRDDVAGHELRERQRRARGHLVGDPHAEARGGWGAVAGERAQPLDVVVKVAVELAPVGRAHEARIRVGHRMREEVL